MLLTLGIVGAMANLEYPATRRMDLVETLHGVEIADPYRWLEDDQSAETKAWVKAQNEVTFGYLKTIPERAKIEEKLKQIWRFDRFGSPEKEGGLYFWTKYDGIQSQPVHFVAKSATDPGRVLLDPNKLSKDGTLAVSGFSVSPDGKHVAYSVSKGGSDWQSWRVRRISDARDTADQIEWSKFSGAAWSKDGKGFYYSRYDAPKKGSELSGVNYFQKLYYHRLGTPQSQDTLVYERKDHKEWGFGGGESEDGRYLIVTVWKGTERETQVLFKDLRKRSAKIEELFMGFDASWGFLGNDGPVLYFLTDKGAPNKRIVKVDVSKRTRKVETVVAESKEPIETASIVGDILFVNRLRDASSVIERFSLQGSRLGEVRLPSVGSAGGFDGRRDHDETFYTFTTFNQPATIYRYNLKSGRSTVWKQPKLTFEKDRYVARRVFYKSFDGTRVPLFLVHRKDYKKDGQNPTLLYGYGGFASAMTPFFSSRMMGWLEMGGVVAVACIRGGSEYGNAWHDAGRLKNKPNVFKDFISAGEFLVNSGVTSPKKLAVMGGSNGGLLVGAVVNMRPDLFGAALPEVGVMDMLRFHKFTIGWAWVSDYGSPDKKDDFEVLRGYSPYHNLKSGTRYPAVLVTTGDHDDRVVPAHSFKYAAALQHVQAGKAPVLIRIETSAGHGAGKPTAKIIEETADQWAFLVRNLGFQPF